MDTLLHSDSCSIWLNKVTIAVVASQVSRHNTPSCAHTVSKHVRNFAQYTGKELIVVCGNLFTQLILPTRFLNMSNYYCKRQKLSERKLSRFTGIHPNVGKTFMIFMWKGLKEAIVQLNIRRENFRASPKICKNRETFLSLNFCCLWYMIPLKLY